MGLFICIQKGMAVLCFFLQGFRKIDGFLQLCLWQIQIVDLAQIRMHRTVLTPWLMVFLPILWTWTKTTKEEMRKWTKKSVRAKGQKSVDGCNQETDQTSSNTRLMATKETKRNSRISLRHVLVTFTLRAEMNKNHSDASANILQTLRALCRSIGLLLWSWPSARYNSPGFIRVDYI